MNTYDRIKMDAATSRVRETGTPVRFDIEEDGVVLRVLVSRKLDHAQVLREREGAAAPQ